MKKNDDKDESNLVSAASETKIPLDGSSFDSSVKAPAAFEPLTKVSEDAHPNKNINTDGVAGFTNSTKPGVVTSKLWRLKNEADADLIKRLESQNWVLGADNERHSGRSGLHWGLVEKCNECKRISSKSEKGEPDTRFLELTSIEDVQSEWAKSPNGLAIAYMAYYVKDDPTHHMTVFYVPCGIGKAAAMYAFSKRVSSELPVLKAVIGPPDTELDLANRMAYSLKVRLRGDIRKLLNRMDIRDWRPHMTIMDTSVYKEGDTIEMVPKFQRISSDLSHIENARSYSSELGVSVNISDLKGASENAKVKEKDDPASGSDKQ